MTATEAKPGHNSELTDEQKQSLFLHHRRLYVDSLAKKKAADAAFKNVCKKAKAEGSDPAMIKFSLRLDDDPAAVAAEQAERERIANWMGTPINGQSDMFDRRPHDEVAYDAGKRAGMAGESGEAPDGFEPTGWARGWRDGQAVLASTLPLFENPDGSKLIPNADRELEGDEFDAALEEA